jgi:hypothetical protein
MWVKGAFQAHFTSRAKPGGTQKCVGEAGCHFLPEKQTMQS